MYPGVRVRWYGQIGLKIFNFLFGFVTETFTPSGRISIPYVRSDLTTLLGLRFLSRL